MIMQYRQFWTSEIENERKSLRELIWYIRAYLVTYCYFKTNISGETQVTSLIEDLTRYRIGSVIEKEALKIYNEMFRLHHSRAIIVFTGTELDGKLVSIEKYNFDEKVYHVTLLDSRSDEKHITIEPGYLKSASLAQLSPERRARVKQKRNVIIVDTIENKTHTFELDLGCFNTFKRSFIHSAQLQPEATYTIFIHTTQSVAKEKERLSVSTDEERNSFYEAIRILGHQDLIDTLVHSESYDHMFTFPFDTEGDQLHNASRNTGIFDKNYHKSFDSTIFTTRMKVMSRITVDGSSFRCLLPNQDIEDESMNVLASW